MRCLAALCCLAILTAADGPTPPLKRLWRAQLGGAVGPLAIAEGRVVAAALTRGLVCLDLADGRELWRVETGRDPLPAAPLIAGDAIVLGDEGGLVRCWALADGALRWQRKLEGKVLGRAARSGATVLVGSYDHRLHALALADGTEQWQVETDGPVHAGPALIGAQALIAGCDGKVRRIDLAGGKQLGAFEAGANIGATPAIVGDLALIAVLDGRWLALAGETVRWQGAAEGERFECAPTADAATAVLVSREGVVRALALADGAERWLVRLGVGVEASPLIAGGHAWIADAGGVLHALALTDGREAWRSNIASPLAEPAAAAGRLLVGAADGSVWCFGSVR
jgi:outer membrane protein assembly factor BamB